MKCFTARVSGRRMSEQKPFDAEELEALGREHVLVISLRCRACQTDWPCSTARLLATVRALNADYENLAIEYREQGAEIAALKSTLEAKDAEIAERGESIKLAYDAAQSLREQLRVQTERAEKAEAQVDVQKRASILILESATTSYQSIEAENESLRATIEGLEAKQIEASAHALSLAQELRHQE